MTACIAQDLDHQVRGAVHDRSQGREGRHRIDEATERTQRVTLSRSPTAALSWASRLMAHRRAASCRPSGEISAPSLPCGIGELASRPRQSCPK